MVMRSGLLGLAGVVTATGAVCAKPPGLPIDPLVEGREPAPLVREFHEDEDAPPARGYQSFYLPRVVNPGLGADPARITDLVTGVRDTLLNRLTVPLGAAPMQE